MSTLRFGNAAATLARHGAHHEVNVAHAHCAANSCEDTHDERNHELRAALFGIEASAQGLRQHRDQLTSVQVDALAEALVAEIRRVRTLLDARTGTLSNFDLGDAIAPVIACARASGLDVHSSVPRGFVVYGSAREHGAGAGGLVGQRPQARAILPCRGTRRGHRGAALCCTSMIAAAGISGPLCERVFERGVCGDDSAGSGLGLFIARRLMAEQGGSITVRNRPGGGTSFCLRFRRPQ